MGEWFLHIGTYGGKWKDWLNLDIIPAYADVAADMCHLPFAEGTINAIFTNHTLEHVSHDGGIEFAKEAHRVLMDGGVMCVGVPDLLEVAWGLWTAPESEQELWMRRVYGGQAYEYDFHRFGYTPQSIRCLFEGEGLTTTGVSTLHSIRPTPTLSWWGFKGKDPKYEFRFTEDQNWAVMKL